MYVIYVILLKYNVPFNVALWKSFKVVVGGYIGKAYSKWFQKTLMSFFSSGLSM